MNLKFIKEIKELINKIGLINSKKDHQHSIDDISDLDLEQILKINKEKTISLVKDIVKQTFKEAFNS